MNELTLLCVLLAGAPVQDSPPLYGISWSYAPTNGMVYRIDETTGEFSDVGLSGVLFANSAACDNNGVVWTSGYQSGDTGRRLFSLNLNTGEAAPGPLLDLGGYSRIISMAVSPTNELYAVALNDHLLKIDFETGSSEYVGWIGQIDNRPIGVAGLAFSPDGTLFGWGVDNANVGLMTIDPLTAEPTDVNPAVGPDVDIQCLEFGPDGTLYGACDALFRIDPATGIATQIGDAGGVKDCRGLAFVPEPSTLGLVLLGLLSLAIRGRRGRR